MTFPEPPQKDDRDELIEELARELEALVSRLDAITPPGTLGLNYKLDGAREAIAKARAWRKGK